MGSDEHFTRLATPVEFLAEVRDAGLTKVVVVGRHTPNQHLRNDTIYQSVLADPMFLGVGSVNPIVQGGQAALDEAERAIRTLGLKSIDVGPGFWLPTAPQERSGLLSFVRTAGKSGRVGSFYKWADHTAPAG